MYFLIIQRFLYKTKNADTFIRYFLGFVGIEEYSLLFLIKSLGHINLKTR